MVVGLGVVVWVVVGVLVGVAVTVGVVVGHWQSEAEGQAGSRQVFW